MEHDILEPLSRILGYHPNNPDYFRQALTHSSYAFEHGCGGDDYQRLEFLGDAVLGMLLAEELYRRFPDASEGELSRFRAALAGEPALAAIARSLGIGAYIRLGRGERLSNGADKDSLLADVLEALLAAVYLDAGIDASRNVLVRLFDHLFESPLETASGFDAKSALQELISARQLPPLSYRLASESGPPHDRSFCFEALLGDEVTGCGSGRSKKIAQQAAAAAALQRLQEQ